MFHHLAHLLGQFCQFTISPRRTKQKVENQSQPNPVIRPDGPPFISRSVVNMCKKGLGVLWVSTKLTLFTQPYSWDFADLDQTNFQLGPWFRECFCWLVQNPNVVQSVRRRYLISRVGRSDYAVTHSPVRQSCKCWGKQVLPPPTPTDELVSYRHGRSKCPKFVVH